MRRTPGRISFTTLRVIIEDASLPEENLERTRIALPVIAASVTYRLRKNLISVESR
jgi:hypothetical protein